MRGKNTLMLNEATVIEALQEYLDKRAASAAYMVKVTRIKQEPQNAINFCGSFNVDVEEQQTEQEKK